MKFSVEQNGSIKGKFLWAHVDNPGAGDCGFYAFGIGLIDTIQREIAAGGETPYLNKLNQLTGRQELYTDQEFKEFHYSQNSQSDYSLLENLKQDLRGILHRYYSTEMRQGSVVVEGSLLEIKKSAMYDQFLEIFYYYHSNKPLNRKCNLLFASPEVQGFAEELSDKVKNKKITGEIAIERYVQDAFMRDLYGEDYLSKTQIPWERTLLNVDELMLDENKEILSKYKQFKTLVENYSYLSDPELFIDENFEYKEQAIQCAKSMKAHQEALKPRRVIVSVGNDPLPNNLELNTLYYQIDPPTLQVKVFSPYFPGAETLPQAKGEDLINILKRDYPNLLTDEAKRNIVFNDNSKKNMNGKEDHETALFRQISSRANDILNEKVLNQDEFIKSSFLNEYQRLNFDLVVIEMKEKRASSEEIQKFEEEFKAKINTLEILINSNLHAIDPLSRERKKELREEKSDSLEFKENSCIIKGLDLLNKPRKWLATHKDLNRLSEIFDVNLKNLENGKRATRSQGSFDEGKPTIVIDNIMNGHWKSKIPVADFARSSSIKYAGWALKTSILSQKEILTVLLSYTKGPAAFFGRTHTKAANELIQMCNERTPVKEIMDKFRQYMDQWEDDPRSSFRKRFNYLDARYRNSEDCALDKRDIKKIFLSYVETNAPNRNHLDAAWKVINDCSNPNINVAQVIEKMEDYVKNGQFDKNSSFMRRVEQVRELVKFYNEKYSDESENYPQFFDLGKIGTVY